MPHGPAARAKRRTAFARALTALRIERGLTLIAMAELLGCTAKQYQKLEYGVIKRGESAPRIARKLGLPSWYFEESLFEDRTDDIYTRRDARTMVRVGVATWAASMSEAEWVEFRREALRRAG